VPWNRPIQPIAGIRSHGEAETRISATMTPKMMPPAKPIAASSKVQSRPCRR
jgi:hypothetical protein